MRNTKSPMHHPMESQVPVADHVPYDQMEEDEGGDRYRSTWAQEANRK